MGVGKDVRRLDDETRCEIEDRQQGEGGRRGGRKPLWEGPAIPPGGALRRDNQAESPIGSSSVAIVMVISTAIA